MNLKKTIFVTKAGVIAVTIALTLLFSTSSQAGPRRPANPRGPADPRGVADPRGPADPR